MTAEQLLYCALLLLGVVFSGLYSGLETGIYTLNRVRLMVRDGRGEPAAGHLRAELAHSERTLSTLLIGTNTCSYLATFALTELLHGAGLDNWTLIAVNAVIVTPVLFVFAETLPKDLFRTHTDHWSYSLSWLLVGTRWLATACGLLPLVRLLAAGVARIAGGGGADPATARQRISQLIKEGVGSGVLTESQTTLADRALAMRQRTVAAEMVPWSAVLWIGLDADRRRRAELVRRRNVTRMPVLDSSGRVVGILSLLDAALAPGAPTESLMRRPMTFAPGTSVREALAAMRAGRQKMAIVGDPSRRPRGIVTLKDLVEPITGELGAW